MLYFSKEFLFLFKVRYNVTRYRYNNVTYNLGSLFIHWAFAISLLTYRSIKELVNVTLYPL